MMASENHNATPLFRLKDGGIAVLFIIGAMLLLLGLTRTDVIHYAQQLDLFYITAVLIGLAIPGPIIRIWDVPGQLLVWNAAGWCLGLCLFGMASIGATPMFPLVLLGFALTFWPRPADAPVPWLGAAIAFAGGLVVCWVLWGNVYVDIPFTTV